MDTFSYRAILSSCPMRELNRPKHSFQNILPGDRFIYSLLVLEDL